MRETPFKYPKQPTEPHVMRRIFAECQAMLNNPHISPEMRYGLEQRVEQLRTELAAAAAPPPAEPKADAEEPAATSGLPPN